MRREANNQKDSPKDDNYENMTRDPLPDTITDREAMTLIPWEDIWTSLKIASHRGDGEMVAVFYETLFKEAVFDDNGAWAWDINKRN